MQPCAKSAGGWFRTPRLGIAKAEAFAILSLYVARKKRPGAAAARASRQGDKGQIAIPRDEAAHHAS